MSIDVYIRADDGEAQVARILDSAMVLPDGWTTVPFHSGAALADRVAGLEDKGFTVEVTDAGAIDRFNVRTTPELGAPVEDGATITTLSPAPVPEESSNSSLVTASPQQIGVGEREDPVDLADRDGRGAVVVSGGLTSTLMLTELVEQVVAEGG